MPASNVGTRPPHPRPQLVRKHYKELSGGWSWQPATDGQTDRCAWAGGLPNPRGLNVPLPPEAPASGAGQASVGRRIWYQREVSARDLEEAGWGRQGERLLVHFGAVDYRAWVWAGSEYVGFHEGGSSPFSFDIPHIATQGPFTLVVCCEDDPGDVAQPRGKQDWHETQHAIWYGRTTGIWQPVWLEAVPAQHIAALTWRTDLPGAVVWADIELSQPVDQPVTLTVELCAGRELLARVEQLSLTGRTQVALPLDRQRNGQEYETLLWSPENPQLIDATVTLGGAAPDKVRSYLGLRSAATGRGWFLLNDRPYYVRSVLSQGFWPDSHLAQSGVMDLRATVQLIKDLGFNAVRVHQKTEDPRFLYWADRLGLLVWGENASAYEFSPTAVTRMTREWTDLVRRDASHPSIVTWVPFNESWGAQHVSHDPAQQAYVRALWNLTKALDPTRPVVSNDGWEHAETDIVTIHDYDADPARVAARYASRGAIAELVEGMGPAGRRLTLGPVANWEQVPVMLSEFGGIKFAPAADAGAWGYSAVASAAEFERVLRELFAAVGSSALTGFCYTQLADTGLERNGLVGADGVPKLPVETIREIVSGTGRAPHNPA